MFVSIVPGYVTEVISVDPCTYWMRYIKEIEFRDVRELSHAANKSHIISLVIVSSPIHL
jgi:hypothetical protein